MKPNDRISALLEIALPDVDRDDGGEARMIARQDFASVEPEHRRALGRWRHANGAEDIVYRASSGAPLSYAGYLRGDRPVARGSTLAIARQGPRTSRSHAALRSFVDEVFVWANTASLARSTAVVPIGDVRPGDFFVMPRRPVGHAVLVLDVARDASGHVALLLGQGFMPAQSFHVLRPSPTAVWFSVDAAAGRIATPFWESFPFDTLHRFGDAGD